MRQTRGVLLAQVCPHFTPGGFFAWVQETGAITGELAWLWVTAEFVINILFQQFFLFQDCADALIFLYQLLDKRLPNLLHSQDFFWPVGLKISVAKKKKSVFSTRLQCSLVDNCIDLGFWSHKCTRRPSPLVSWVKTIVFSFMQAFIICASTLEAS